LVTLFDSDRVGALQRGDTVMRVNGQDIERPEQFKEVWDKLAAQPELVLLVQREGRESELHYRIVE
jgi:type II secretory pathway component PulC